MKKLLITSLVLTLSSLLHSAETGLVCRDDQRMSNGSLSEIILNAGPDGYQLQSQYVPSLNSPTITIENWGKNLNCNIDAKANLAFCQSADGQTSIQLKERKDTFIDSLEENAKKKTVKSIDVVAYENGVQVKAASFAAALCDSFGGDA